MMKTQITIFAIYLMAFNTYAQYNGGTMQTLFFGHQPSARSEALGKAYSSIGGDIYSTWYNPAGLGQLEGLEINGNFAQPYYGIDDVKFTFAGLGYKINQYVQCGFSANHVSFGEIIFTDEYGNPLGTFEPYSTAYTVTLSSNPVKNFYVGINANFLTDKLINDDIFNCWTFDFGLLETIPLFKNKENLNVLQLGGSVKNFTVSKIKYEGEYFSHTDELPVIARIGANYKFGTKNDSRFLDLRIVQAMALLEYQNLFNYKYLSAYRFGCETILFEILALRIGYYHETFGESSKRKDLTYGLGINLPFEKLCENKLPLTIKLDFTNLQPPGVNSNYNDVDNMNSFGLSVNYRFGTKKSDKNEED